MNLLVRLSIVCLLSLALTACEMVVTSAKGSTRSEGIPDSSASRLIAMSEQALHIAQKESSDVLLRQVETDLSITAFRFVDGALTREIVVIVPEPDAPTEKWSTVINTVSPLLMYRESGLDLQGLRVGPARVADAITAHWPGCTVREISLSAQNNQLTWLAFCNTSEGLASGSMDNETGVFQPSDAPPARFALTATPVP
ncbi:MAG TPA: hypothetical protein VK249_21375 [Anaerolineales bacterium]|nr:hypothetical protein [Anaerolineales bacterium]